MESAASADSSTYPTGEDACVTGFGTAATFDSASKSWKGCPFTLATLYAFAGSFTVSWSMG